MMQLDLNIFWHHISVVINDNPERESCFTYELSQEPRAFIQTRNDVQKAEISTWCYHHKLESKKSNVIQKNSFFVVVGGYLMGKVVWPDSVMYVCTFQLLSDTVV